VGERSGAPGGKLPVGDFRIDVFAGATVAFGGAGFPPTATGNRSDSLQARFASSFGVYSLSFPSFYRLMRPGLQRALFVSTRGGVQVTVAALAGVTFVLTR